MECCRNRHIHNTNAIENKVQEFQLNVRVPSNGKRNEKEKNYMRSALCDESGNTNHERQTKTKIFFYRFGKKNKCGIDE